MGIILGLNNAAVGQSSAEEMLGPRIQPRGTIRFNSEGAGFDHYLSAETFIPFFQQQGASVGFFEGKLLMATPNTALGYNLTLGYRALTGNQKFALGGYLSYDFRNTGDAGFNQLGLGLELLGDVDVRINGYIPLGTRQVLLNQAVGSIGTIQNNQILLDRDRLFQEALTGFDFEVGTRLVPLGKDYLRGYAGLYYYSGESIADFVGVRARLATRPIEYLSLSATVQNDDRFGTKAWFGIGVSFPGVAGSRRRAPEQGQNVAARLGESPERLSFITVDNELVEDQIAAINPATGQPYRVFTVDTGAGSAARINDLPLAQNDIVLVGVADTDGNTAGQGTINLRDGVQLLSTTVNRQLPSTVGTITIPALTPSSQKPIIAATIILAKNNTIEGFNITPPSGQPAIIGNNVNPPRILNNQITTINANGISITNSTGVQITNNQITSTNGSGIILVNAESPVVRNNTVTITSTTAPAFNRRGISITESTNATIENNTIDGGVGEGIGLDNALGNVTIRGNTVRNVGQTATDTNLEASIFIRNNRGNANITIEDNVTENNLTPGNRVDGIEFNLCRGDSFAVADRFSDNQFANCAAPASATVIVRNNQIRNIGTGTDGSDGIDFNIGDGANLTAVLENNVVNNISDAGMTFDIVSSAAPIAPPSANIIIRNNEIRNILNDDAITLESNSAGQVVLNIENNVIQNIGNSNDGIDIEFTTTAASPTPAQVRIVGNQLNNISDRGIEVDTTNNARLAIEISNNTLTNTGEAIRLRGQNNSVLTPTVNNNTITVTNAAGIILQNVQSPVVRNNTVTITSTTAPAFNRRGISITESTNATIENNTVNGGIGEGIGLDNALGNVTIRGNTVRNVGQTATDTNLEASIFIRNNRGNANITIEDNVTENNLTPGNRVDGIEFNLCRGDSFAVADRFSDNQFANCAAPASATVIVRNNQIRNIGTGTDGSDGIDFNIGDGANLTAVLENNVVNNISDAGMTFDIVSSAAPIAPPSANIIIRNNEIRNILNDDAITLESNSAGQVVLNIENNVIQNIGNGNDGIDIEFTTNAANPTPARVRIVGNQLSGVSDRGIEIDTTNNASLQLEVSNNSIQATAGGEAVRLRAQNTSRLNATVNNNTLTQGNPATRSLELRADNNATLCANVFSNVETSGAGFRLRPQNAPVIFRVVDRPNLSLNNGGVTISTTGAGTVTNITPAIFSAAPPAGCTFP
ncbi:right-handed parallel beta-helix repeat-containing protein [Thermosynechococcus sp. TA-1]|uniref:right-handed parallel beta-helix repeat-containing protein n=1 Tax=Thermosynechococcus sp. TA-1 TaxID=2813673 RepID=UPI00197F797F|nr:right-handed parallel beta-helix repeat-containing protein [Thermosynechococcus sp. TA-1]QSF49230.1 right-handed parallel beta-helix repeat-containing protein [Thermosynechococcus sp. TA-1]